MAAILRERRTRIGVFNRGGGGRLSGECRRDRKESIADNGASVCASVSEISYC